MILAVDTSLGSAVALTEQDGRVRADLGRQNALGHAEVIGTLLQGALAEAGAAPGDVSLVAVGMGPGPFTGLRIGIAAARTFAQARGIPVVGVVSHDAAALAEYDAGTSGRLVISTDARRRELAVSAYDGLDEHGLPRRVTGPELHPRGTDLSTEALADERLAKPAEGSTPPVVRDVTTLNASDVARIAARRAAAGLGPGAAEPLYLRSPDVVAGHRPKRVSA